MTDWLKNIEKDHQDRINEDSRKQNAYYNSYCARQEFIDGTMSVLMEICTRIKRTGLEITYNLVQPQPEKLEPPIFYAWIRSEGIKSIRLAMNKDSNKFELRVRNAIFWVPYASHDNASPVGYDAERTMELTPQTANEQFLLELCGWLIDKCNVAINDFTFHATALEHYRRRSM